MKKGFTLVELSIVLVIIGLLIGGILVAQSMISNARIKNVMREQEQYLIAIRFFDQQFGGLPGDSSRAGTLLGVSGGDDDGGVEWNSSSEVWYAWQQLALSGYIEGSYTGAASGGGAAVGVNFPESEEFKGYGWFLMGAAAWDMQYTNTTEKEGITQLRLSGRYAGPSSTDPYPWTGPLTVDEAYSIDAKFDDGAPGTGEIGVHPTWSTIWGCSSTADANTSVYNLSVDGEICHISFWLPKGIR